MEEYNHNKNFKFFGYLLQILEVKQSRYRPGVAQRVPGS
jgi:hypothetical protein